MYNNNENLLSNISGLKYNNNIHACHLYKNKQEYLKLLNNVKNNINISLEVQIIGDKKDGELHYLINEKDLSYLNKQHHFANDASNMNIIRLTKLLKNLNKEYNSTLLVLLDWKNIDTNNISTNEEKITQFLPENCVFICQYNKAKFSDKALKNIIKVHPLVIEGFKLLKNVYYMPPNRLVQNPQNQSDILQWVNSIPNTFHPGISEPELDYKNIFNHYQNSVLVYNQNNNILAVNDTFYKTFGYIKNNILGNEIKSMIPKQHLPKIEKALNITQQKKYIKFESKILNKNNNEIPVEICSRLINENNNISLFIIRDIRQKKSIEKKLLASENKYRQLVETTGDIILTHDPKGQITFINQTGLDFLNYPVNDILNLNMSTLLSKGEKKKFIKRKNNRLAGNFEHLHYEIVLMNYKGEKIYLDVHDTPILEEQEYKGALLVARDISERKEKEKKEKKIQKQKQMSQKLETLGTLASGIGHDFNNILTPILGYSELIRQNIRKDSKNYEYTKEIMQGCLRAKELIFQMLSFSRDNQQTKKPLHIIPIIKEALKLLRPSIPRTIGIEQNLPESCPIINADPTQIHQVIMNLCTNAYQAMEEKGGTLSVKLKTIYIDKEASQNKLELQPGRYIKISISDTGEGIDTETKERIFEPYFTTKEKGAGMGLAVVHGIVRSHNGSIQVYSDVGVGTTFNVYLPIYEGKKEFDNDSESEAKQGSGVILLVDDREDVADALANLLSQLGYQIVVANSSANAWEIFMQNPEIFDIVLTDYIMPEMTGIGLGKKFHSINKELPIILMSGHGYNINQESLKPAGIKKVIYKPILANKITKILEQYIKS